MADYKTLRDMQATWLSVAEGRQAWSDNWMPSLCRQVSILAGHLADLMMPIPPQPPCNDDHVAVGCRLFSQPGLIKES